ncbi:flagellar export chaperone FliS [Pseudoalteromonas sp. T1lg48]|uniref:flagellar export chaperone FliS n=1 Tax=Pseudoalteromonas sp. T1lg48 TaxID=2077100 RepID=UPI000CF6A300|nr:flagellar export chaperone FliS [Pseudoalteromonas sp. T1lg48]
MAHSSINKYRQVKVSSVREMRPYDQVNLVFTNIIGKLAAANGAIARNDLVTKGENLSHCITLLGALQDALDMTQGEISDNLHALYDFCQRRLVEANINNDVEIINEVSGLIKTIKEGWDTIPTEARDGAAHA